VEILKVEKYSGHSNFIFVGLSLLASLLFTACGIKSSRFSAAPPEHVIFDGFLQKHLKNGPITATSILEDSSQLRFYLSYLSRRHPNHHWHEQVQLAYWLNLHNALVVAQYYNPTSLRYLQNKQGNFLIEGKKYTLQQIKNKCMHGPVKASLSLFALYLPQQNEAPMPNRALMAEGVIQQLHELSKNYLNNPVFNQIEPNQVVLSPFFRQNKYHLRPLRAFVIENSRIILSPHFKLKFRE
jgi:hypothetical protein